ncbi:MAG: HAMP domain-containing histidine kinase [Butyrivibrio sp.]|nr:HAMP domain-containing histidine kinase [Butyrivibrio sp.]
MKFRYKVLFVNIILLSAALGSAGYLMIRRNFELAKSAQIHNAVAENNILQASVEYELLRVINGGGDYDAPKELERIGSLIRSGLSSSDFYIKFDSEYAYSCDGMENLPDDGLFENISLGGKNYEISRRESGYYIYVTSCSTVNGAELCVVSRRDISEAYLLMDSQISFYRLLAVIIVCSLGAVMYGLSAYLTRPLERLNRVTDEITEGNYDVHIRVGTNDEVGLLTDKFNRMSRSVASHIDELNDMVRRRERFVADFTHEIKTPMTAIIGYADMLRSVELSEEERLIALNYIFSEGRRLERMSSKLFDLIYFKQKQIEMLPIHTTDMCAEIAGIMKPVLDGKGITLAAEIEPAVIYGSRELLVTVFTNIIDNAGKASDVGAVISFGGVLKENGIYELSVEDCGIGMSDEDAERICEEFYMADKSRSRKEGGAGLGMSLAAAILERHAAELSVESRLGEGTTVTAAFNSAVVDFETEAEAQCE